MSFCFHSAASSTVRSRCRRGCSSCATRRTRPARSTRQSSSKRSQRSSEPCLRAMQPGCSGTQRGCRGMEHGCRSSSHSLGCNSACGESERSHNSRRPCAVVHSDAVVRCIVHATHGVCVCVCGVAKVLRKHPHVFVLSDEIYEKITYVPLTCRMHHAPHAAQRTTRCMPRAI